MKFSLPAVLHLCETSTVGHGCFNFSFLLINFALWQFYTFKFYILASLPPLSLISLQWILTVFFSLPSLFPDLWLGIVSWLIYVNNRPHLCDHRIGNINWHLEQLQAHNWKHDPLSLNLSVASSSAVRGRSAWASPTSMPDWRYTNLYASPMYAITSLWVHSCNGCVCPRT